MKPLMLALSIITVTTIGNVDAKQDISPNPIVISQKDGRRIGELSNRPADVKVTQQIRQELLRDDVLSVKAKNIQIFVADKGVTLKGSVVSNAEMERVLKHAYITAPKHKIYNQISVVK